MLRCVLSLCLRVLTEASGHSRPPMWPKGSVKAPEIGLV